MLGLKTSDFLHFLFFDPQTNHHTLHHSNAIPSLFCHALFLGFNRTHLTRVHAAQHDVDASFWSQLLCDDCEGTVMPATGADADVGALLLLPEEEEEDSGVGTEEEEAEVNHS